MQYRIRKTAPTMNTPTPYPPMTTGGPSVLPGPTPKRPQTDKPI
ncbi:MAG: hypothetical protein ACRDRH_20340 [Pseudonocardia sp.]